MDAFLSPSWEVSEAETPRWSQCWGLGLPLWVQEHQARQLGDFPKKNENNPLRQNEDSSPERYFLGIITSKNTSVTKITHLLFQRTLLPAAASRPRKQWKFFSSLGKKKSYYSAKCLPGGPELLSKQQKRTLWSCFASAAKHFYKPS